ncbi:hypothetical protein [Novosphingobium guangzhouense]|nr:hypothetical protein [Novosphingobium guangzhouense]
MAIAVAMAVSLGLFSSSEEPAQAQEETSLGTIRADGKLVLRVFAPALY